MRTLIVLMMLYASAQGQVIMSGVVTARGDPFINTVANPTTSNSGGSCTGSDGAGWACTAVATVTMATTTTSATICYRIDGMNPAASSPGSGTCAAGSTTYSTGISTASTTTYKMIATKSGFIDSGVVTVTYTISGVDLPLITSGPSSSTRQYDGCIGFQFKLVGGTSRTITKLGRWMFTGNVGTHTVSLRDLTSSTTLGSVSINMTACTVGAQCYVSLGTPITISGTDQFAIVSKESASGGAEAGDVFEDVQAYTFDSILTPSSIDAVYSSDGVTCSTYAANGTVGNAWVPTNALYH